MLSITCQCTIEYQSQQSRNDTHTRVQKCVRCSMNYAVEWWPLSFAEIQPIKLMAKPPNGLFLHKLSTIFGRWWTGASAGVCVFVCCAYGACLSSFAEKLFSLTQFDQLKLNVFVYIFRVVFSVVFHSMNTVTFINFFFLLVSFVCFWRESHSLVVLVLF